MGVALIWLLVVFSILMSVQAAYTLYLMLYTWDQSDTYKAARAPRPFRRPQLSFSALLPARHEEGVIGRTIERVMRANYPRPLIEAIVVCEEQDTGTIATAQATIDALAAEGITGARIITFSDGPINKPHSLNEALPEVAHDVVTIFDAEDEIHPEIFNVVNTVMLNEGVRVVQSGVQLMNYASTWFSPHNVLEYYFWFKSRLHVHAKNGMTPLGGNTVFFITELVRTIGGWDENNLTEDAEIGIRLSALGERVRVVYDDDFVTREETPPNLGSFVRQRTRWNQGFLQTLRKGDWRRVPQMKNRFMALYILAFPFVQAVLGLYVPVSLAMMLWLKLPVLVTLPLLLPSYLLIGHYLLTVVGLHEFAETHSLRLPRFWLVTGLRLLLTYFPYQWVLGYAAAKALWREMWGVTNWEKTDHTGAHRALSSYASAPVVDLGLLQAHADEVSQPFPVATSGSTLFGLRRAAAGSRRVRYGLASVWLVGLVACASALGPFGLTAGRMAQAVGQALPLVPASAPRSSVSDESKMWGGGGRALASPRGRSQAALDPPALRLRHTPAWYKANSRFGGHRLPGGNQTPRRQISASVRTAHVAMVSNPALLGTRARDNRSGPRVVAVIRARAARSAPVYRPAQAPRSPAAQRRATVFRPRPAVPPAVSPPIIRSYNPGPPARQLAPRSPRSGQASPPPQAAGQGDSPTSGNGEGDAPSHGDGQGGPSHGDGSGSPSQGDGSGSPAPHGNGEGGSPPHGD
jgi:cellulose synthase/poly-beta-1,6-N-acetylglucosamine synthase-like glycosyltransferase